MLKNDKKLATVLILIYVVIVSILVATGIAHDENLANLTGFIASTGSVTAAKYLPKILTIYLVRAGLIIVPLWVTTKHHKNWYEMTRFGIWFAVLPEIVVLVSAFNMILPEDTQCTAMFACGFGPFIYVPIIVSAIAQIVGMLFGLIVALYAKKRY